MEKVRAVVIGFGGMGRQYVEMLYAGQIEGMVLAGVCCRNEKGQKELRECFPEAAIYKSVEETFAHADEFDAAVIVTPHSTHVEIGKMAAAAGVHILMDKPAGISTKEVRELLAETEKNGVSYGMIFNVRMNPVFFQAKKMIENGEIGKPCRALWMCNNWFRTPAYHNSSPWRSTWKGEHGGLLLNQCPHYLDIWQWLFGMPESVRASIDYGKYNDFTVDDNADLQFFYKDGLHGTFIASSGEAPGVNRLEIWGTKGLLRIENCEELTFDENIVSVEQFREENKEIYGMPKHEKRTVSVDWNQPLGYQKIFSDFAEHIRKGTPLLVTGEDGLRTLMLTNGAYLSSWTDKKISFPIDDELYAALLKKKEEE